jgi:glutamate/tyrosine decarboxylase-like PLP-dependent enzyme
MQVPYDAGCILIRESAKQRDTFGQGANYLRRHPRGLSAGEPWPCDLGPDLSRGFRALKVWFTLLSYGTERLGRIVDKSCDLARALADRVAAEPELERVGPVPLNIVCFRYVEASGDLNALTAEIVADIQESGVAAPSTTVIDGKTVIRAALFNHRTEHQDIDALVDAVLRFGRKRAG